MAIQNTTNIPEVKDTIVMLRELSADEKVRQEAYYREKRLHDEASALGNARREGFAEGLAKGKAITAERMRKNGFTEEQIKIDDIDADRLLQIGIFLTGSKLFTI